MTPQSVPSRRGDPGSSIRHVPWAKRLQHLDWLTRNERAFRRSAPAVWNSLPQTVLSSDSDAVFKLRHSSDFLFFLCSLTRCLAPAPLKLRPYGAIQIYYYYYFCRARRHDQQTVTETEQATTLTTGRVLGYAQ